MNVVVLHHSESTPACCILEAQLQYRNASAAWKNCKLWTRTLQFKSSEFLTNQKPSAVWSGWPRRQDQRLRRVRPALEPARHPRGKKRSYLVWGRGLKRNEEERKWLKGCICFLAACKFPKIHHVCLVFLNPSWYLLLLLRITQSDKCRSALILWFYLTFTINLPETPKFMHQTNLSKAALC